MSKSESIKVVCRFRGGQGDNPDWVFLPDGASLVAPKMAANSLDAPQFTFDSVLDSDVNNETMYNMAAKDKVTAFMDGFNCTIFAYGQSGSGKTFSMLGPDEVVKEIIDGNGEVSQST
jgi:hypothetical protein